MPRLFCAAPVRTNFECRTQPGVALHGEPDWVISALLQGVRRARHRDERQGAVQQRTAGRQRRGHIRSVVFYMRASTS